VKHSSLLLKCGLFIVTSFQTVWKKDKNYNFTVEKPDTQYFNQVIKLNINGDNSYW
jgi:hypothetical protein